jgi:MFS family permease
MSVRAHGSRLVAVMCIAEILCMSGFATYPALLPVLRANWNLSNSAAGLIGGILFLGYVAAVPVLTSLTDRVDARRVYMLSALVAASGSALFATVVNGLVGALVAQLLFGIGFAGVFMPGLKALSDRIDEAIQSRATAMYMSLSGFGLAGSYFLAGIISAYASWRIAFALAMLGPLIAAFLVLTLMEPRQPVAGTASPGFFASFGIVFRNRPALGYTAGYIAHCWEVQGLRAWMVAFLAFAAGQANGSGGLDAATLAALISLGGIASSIGCNEFAKKLGRVNLVTGIMVTGLVLGLATGFSWRVSFIAVIALVALYYATMMADAGALAAGTVAAAKPEQRGATLGVYSMLGYGAGLVAPTVFGVVLDLAGGAQSGWAWAAAFAVLAAPNLVAIAVLRRLAEPAAAPRRLVPTAVTRFATRLGAQRDLPRRVGPGPLGR